MTVREWLGNKTPNSKYIEYENKDYHRGYREGYTIGAKEQQDVDIRRAVEWMKEVFLEQYLNAVWSGAYEDHVFNDKFFSDFEQAMKGDTK